MSAPVAIVDAGMGNLFSVQQACNHAGLAAHITKDPAAVADAPAVILPGVGAFGNAMAGLRAAQLDEAIVEAAASGKPVLGICLGMQLLMESSDEFGTHEGLGLFTGTVERLESDRSVLPARKVPHVGWAPLHAPSGTWQSDLLAGIDQGTSMYFVHSYHAVPADEGAILATSHHGEVPFVAAVSRQNVVGLQCHPERSGPQGLRVYANLARSVNE